MSFDNILLRIKNKDEFQFSSVLILVFWQIRNELNTQQERESYERKRRREVKKKKRKLKSKQF